MSFGLRWAFNVKEWNPMKMQWKLCAKCVQKDERDRCNKFYFVDDCKSSMIGQLLMRKAVSESLAVEYDKITFSRTASGKPYISGENENKMFFNVSHNGDFCVLASEMSMPVGVDVMKVEYRSEKPLSSYFQLMKKQFSSYEWDFISLPGLEREQLERFFRLWCLKESYVKAVGTGIAYDLKSLSFSCKTLSLKYGEIVTDTKLYKDSIFQRNWKFEESLLDDNHCVAVAVHVYEEVEQSDTPLNYIKNFEVIKYDELMRKSIPFEETDENFWEDFTSKGKKHSKKEFDLAREKQGIP